MKKAIIDLGTNTFTLIIFEKSAAKFNIIFKKKIEVKLGQGGINKGFISEKAFQRGLEAMKNHHESIQFFNPTKVIAFATSAIRSTSNGNFFIQKVKELTGIEIEIIDGNKEALLIYKGVKHALDLKIEPSLIMDIGGGSTEFIIANSKEVFWKKSFQLGVSRLKETFKPEDPISNDNINSLNNHLKNSLITLKQAIDEFKPSILIGSSGSFDSLALMTGYKFQQKNILKNTNSFKFDIKQIDWAYDYIIKSNYKQRLTTPGISKMRADMIVVAMVLIRYIIKEYSIKEVKLSTYSLKEGVMYSDI